MVKALYYPDDSGIGKGMNAKLLRDVSRENDLPPQTLSNRVERFAFEYK